MRQEGQSVYENQRLPPLNQLMISFCMIKMHSLKISVHIILITVKTNTNTKQAQSCFIKKQVVELMRPVCGI